jgi:hypothetical protein
MAAAQVGLLGGVGIEIGNEGTGMLEEGKTPFATVF